MPSRGEQQMTRPLGKLCTTMLDKDIYSTTTAPARSAASRRVTEIVRIRYGDS